MHKYSIENDNERPAWNLVFKNDHSWREARKGERADFLYGMHSKNSDIVPYPNSTLSYFHNKYDFFKILKSKQVSCMPKTFFSFNEFSKNSNRGANTNKGNDMWFYKLATYDSGTGVIPFFDSDKDCDKLKRLLHHESREYILQQGVKDLMLYDGRKFDIRIHVLISPSGKVYVYKNACMRISRKKYTSECSCKKHQLTNGSLGAEAQYTDKWSQWESVYPSVQKSIKEIIYAMKQYLVNGKYLLLGADFIFDKNNKAWVLELNTYPNLYYKPDPHLQPTLTHMLKNMVKLLMHQDRDTSSQINTWEYLMTV